MSEATVASKGQVTIPAEIRRALRLTAEERVIFTQLDDGATVYEFDKSTVLGTFNVLLETQELEFQDEPALERALGLYRQGSADFADCLHAGQCGSPAVLR
jgi:AbrB family looped-hinge helix DNA binding protein